MPGGRLTGQAGVAEYWFVDRAHHRVLVHRLGSGGRYGEPLEVGAGATLASPLLPGFAVAVDEVLGSHCS